MSNMNFVSSRNASKCLGVTTLTLHNWEKKGLIETIRSGGNHRLYNVKKYMLDNNITDTDVLNKKNDVSTDKTPKIENKTDNTDNNIDDVLISSNNELPKKQNVCYLRVSSVGQNNILKQQKEYIKTKYPDYLIVEDIGLMERFNKKGLIQLIDLVNDEKVENVLLISNDSISKFGIDLLNYLLKKQNGGQVIMETDDKINADNHNDVIDELLETITKCSNELVKLKGKK